jgi:hypothetical protein
MVFNSSWELCGCRGYASYTDKTPLVGGRGQIIIWNFALAHQRKSGAFSLWSLMQTQSREQKWRVAKELHQAVRRA